MKNSILLILFLMMFLCSCGSEKETKATSSKEVTTEENTEIKSEFGKPTIKDIEEVKKICNTVLNERYDEFDEVYRYYAIPIVNESDNFKYTLLPYLSIDSECNNCNLFISINYEGNDWMSLQTLKIKTDNQTYSIDLPRGNHDVKSGKVFENIIVPIDVLSYYALRDMVSNESCQIRLLGRDSYYDMDFSSDVIKEFKNTINSYNKICGMQEV